MKNKKPSLPKHVVKPEELERYAQAVREAIQANKNCKSGPFGRLEVYTSGEGFNHSKGIQIVYPEILAMLHMSEDNVNFWYGYAAPSHKETLPYVSLIVPMNKFINPSDTRYTLGYFNNTTSCFVGYRPCRIQNPDDAYKEAETFSSAVDGLIAMIGRFDLKLRDPELRSRHLEDPFETRIFDYLGFRNW